MPHPWGLSPVKRGSPSFLDIDLPEDEEEDEDFNPEKVRRDKILAVFKWFAG